MMIPASPIMEALTGIQDQISRLSQETNARFDKLSDGMNILSKSLNSHRQSRQENGHPLEWYFNLRGDRGHEWLQEALKLEKEALETVDDFCEGRKSVEDFGNQYDISRALNRLKTHWALSHAPTKTRDPPHWMTMTGGEVWNKTYDPRNWNRGVPDRCSAVIHGIEKLLPYKKPEEPIDEQISRAYSLFILDHCFRKGYLDAVRGPEDGILWWKTPCRRATEVFRAMRLTNVGGD